MLPTLLIITSVLLLFTFIKWMGAASAHKSAERRLAFTEQALADVEGDRGMLEKFADRMDAGHTVTASMLRDSRLWNDVDSTRAEQVLRGGALALDVRSPAETLAGMIPGARHIPIDELPQRLGELPRDKELLVYCAAGSRSTEACRVLDGDGFQQLFNLSGGFQAWKGARALPQ